MKAIILAAGKGTRLRPITNTTPKPMIKILGKPILEYSLENIYDKVDEIIIVVKYLKQKISDYFGDNYKGTKITYFEQGEDKGTAGAIKGINFEDDFILINGDSIFDKKDLQKIFELDSYGALVLETQTPEKYGIFSQDENGFATKIIEKPKEFVGNLANLGVYKFSKEIFDLNNKISLSPRGEYEITDTINLFLKNNKFKLIKLSGEFIDIGYPWDILDANSYFLEKLENSKISGIVEENVTIKGNIILEDGAILKSGTYIEGNCYIGKNTIVGPNCYIRGNSVFGENCKVGNAVEIKNSCFGDNTKAGHLTYIGDSVIGNNVNFGAGFLSANLRHDKSNIKVMIKGELVDTKKKKFGFIAGDNVKTGIGTRIYPGRILETDGFTLPGEIVK